MRDQLRLFEDEYARCQGCGRDVGRIRRTRRFWLCMACWERIVPVFGEGTVAADDYAGQAQVAAYWGWYREMERRFPVPRSVKPVRRRDKQEDRDIGQFWPFCRRCGVAVAEYEYREGYVPPRSLFGGPRRAYCPVCDAQMAVESVARMAPKLHPGWDDEDWLDLLYRSHREAFEVGVLPGYWFELRRGEQVWA